MTKQQQKTIKRRKILMKQKCTFIDNQISQNLSKLEELMRAIKSRQQPTMLCTICQVEESIIDEQNLLQKSKLNEKVVKNQLRQRFKYSIQREYEFDQNQNSHRQHDNRYKTNNGHHTEQELVKQVEQYPSTSQFTPTLSRCDDQEMLLSRFSDLSENRQQTKEEEPKEQEDIKIVKLSTKSSIKYAQHTITNQPYNITIETRYDWISKYLDRQLNDTIVKGLSSEGQEIRVMRFNNSLDQFVCKFINQNHYQQQQQQWENALQQLQRNPTQKRSSFSPPQQQQISYTYHEFIHHNAEVEVQFHKHNFAVNIIEPSQQQVIKLDLINSENKVRILVKSENQNINNMQRIMIFKQLPATNPNDEKYQIVWTKYDKVSFVQDVILDGESNYLVTNLCCNPSSEVSLIFNQKDIENAKIQKSKYDPWKSYNILCSSFQQCSKVFMSQNVFDGTKPLEFLRSNFLDYGLVLEIYQNIYPEKVAFLDIKQKASGHEEDIELLFPDIYTSKQNHNVYLPKQLVIKFFQVTEKPARLYFPQKRVLVGSKIAQNVTIHSTFK